MKLFILAAGKGTRLGALTEHTPKALLDLGDGTTILERQITSAIHCGRFAEIIVITGFEAAKIDAAIARYQDQIPITAIYNPFYHLSNNLISLWLGNYKMLEDDFVITNGDNIYKDMVFDKIMPGAAERIQLTVDYKEAYDEDDMKVQLDNAEHVQKVHKQIPLADTQAESVGLVLVKGKQHRQLFHQKICELVRKEEYLNKFWLEIFNALSQDGVTVVTRAITPDDWQEVDFRLDIEQAKQLISRNGSGYNRHCD